MRLFRKKKHPATWKNRNDAGGPVVLCEKCYTFIELGLVTENNVGDMDECCQMTMINLAMGEHKMWPGMSNMRSGSIVYDVMLKKVGVQKTVQFDTMSEAMEYVETK